MPYLTPNAHVIEAEEGHEKHHHKRNHGRKTYRTDGDVKQKGRCAERKCAEILAQKPSVVLRLRHVELHHTGERMVTCLAQQQVKSNRQEGQQQDEVAHSRSFVPAERSPMYNNLVFMKGCIKGNAEGCHDEKQREAVFSV